ncbi:copia protein [Tanacetum coccineum]
MEKTMKRYGVNHRFSTSYHPQTSGQVENTNRALKRILEKTVKDNPAIWSRKLDDALWVFCIAYKTPTDTLLQPLFDECFCPPPCVDHPVPEVVAPVPIISTGSPSSTSVDQDAPSPKFVDLENPNHVYKLKKALYGLKQAPRVWYDLLLSFLLSQKFSKGTIDPTLFIRREGKDILLDSYIALTAFADADHAGCQDTEDVQT